MGWALDHGQDLGRGLQRSVGGARFAKLGKTNPSWNDLEGCWEAKGVAGGGCYDSNTRSRKGRGGGDHTSTQHTTHPHTTHTFVNAT